MSPQPTADRSPLPLPEHAPLAVPEGALGRARAFGAVVDDATLAKIGDFLGRLLAMNERVNLTAIRDPADAWERHALDALTLAPHLAELRGATPKAEVRVCDIGSGGGVPALPLAIALPSVRFTLVESIKKKAHFLAETARSMGLANVDVRGVRAEDVARTERGRFDAVTARAVARIALLAPLCAPLVRRGGRLLLIKGERAPEELEEAARALRTSGLRHEATHATPTGRIVVLERER
jgi:16S rRNA (guanine527-N7)-methyltransferase